MSRQRPVPKNYHNQSLMIEFNELIVRIKANLFLKDSDKIDLANFPKPSVEEIDFITNRIMSVLKQDNEPMIKY